MRTHHPSSKQGLCIGGRWLVGERIGEGGMCTVFHAEDVRTGLPCALKVLPRIGVRSEAGKRFAQEALVLGSIESENVVSFLDYGVCSETGVAFLAMEFLDGLTLETLLEKKHLTLRGFLTVILEVLRAFEAIHAKNVVHRDFKPENVMCDFTGKAKIKLLDFGASLIHGLGVGRITRSGQTCGTPEFMAPEQIVGNEPNGGVDFYALGVLMFRVLTGRFPFQGDSAMDLFNKHLFQEVPCPRAWWSLKMPVVEELASMTERLLIKDSAFRLSSASEIRRTILNLIQRDQIPAHVKLDWCGIA